MEDTQPFVDFYEVLQVTPACDAKRLEKAYRHFAHMYHPDHPETADVDKFQAVTEAYAVLRNASKRAEYDQEYRRLGKGTIHSIPLSEDIRIDEKDAVADAEIHEKILFFLYKRRREHPDDPGVLNYHVQALVKCSDESFDFHIWYLKSKGYLAITEQSGLAITIDCVDHVIAMSRAVEERKLLTKENVTQAMRRAGD